MASNASTTPNVSAAHTTTNAGNTSTPSTLGDLGDLPVELRLIIYSHVFSQLPPTLHANHAPNTEAAREAARAHDITTALALLRTGHAIRDEVLRYLDLRQILFGHMGVAFYKSKSLRSQARDYEHAGMEEEAEREFEACRRVEEVFFTVSHVYEIVKKFY